MNFSLSHHRKSLLMLVFFCVVVVHAILNESQLAVADATQSVREDYEPNVLAIIEAIRIGNLEQALTQANAHVSNFPKSRIGYLLKGDILQAMSSQVFDASQTTRSQAEALQGLKHQIRNRWRHGKGPGKASKTMIPSSLVDMGRHEYVIVTDMQAGRLYLYRNVENQPVLLKDYYLTVGAAGYGKEVQGDKKTPIGIYSIYQHIAPGTLPDKYGNGAFPVNYPNRFDRYRDRTGYGIWLHGSPSDIYARSPWASDGCVVLSNDDLLDIEQYIDVKAHTPVILSDTINWISAAELRLRREDYLKVLEDWKHDWESLNTKTYLSHYAQDQFNFGRNNFKSWADRKHLVNKTKTFVRIDLDIQSLFLYPGEQDMFVVQYKQRYLSDDYASEINKEQYWKRDKQGRWKILYEGSSQ